MMLNDRGGGGERRVDNWGDLYEYVALVVKGKYSYNLGLLTSTKSVCISSVRFSYSLLRLKISFLLQ